MSSSCLYRSPFIALALAVALPALGQTAPSSAPSGQARADTVEDIVVMARRTAENLQQTPISITALTANDIAERGLDSVLDVAKAAPSVTLMPGGNYAGKSALAYIRGVGQDQFTYAFEPGVGFYVDDVYYGTVYGSIFQLADISSIQVLRGPQGTLFGKNNEGGAILLYTPDPQGDDSGEVEAGYGSYNRLFTKGDLDVPLVKDALALRLSAATNNMDGYVNRIDYACSHPGAAGTLQPATTAGNCVVGTEGGDNEQSLRAALKWTPSQDFSVVLKGEVHNDQSEAGPEDVLIQRPAPAGSDTANYNQYVALPMFGFPISSPATVTGNPFTSYSSYTDPTTGYSTAPANHEQFYSIGGTINWDSPWGVHVKDILAYQKFRALFANTDGTPLPTYLEENILTHHQFSEEFQLGGKLLDDRLEWIVGAYYLTAYGTYAGHVELPSQVVVEPGVLPFAPQGVYGLNFNLDDPTIEQSTSGFVHGIYHITDKLSAEIGARYSTDEKAQYFNHVYTASNPLNLLLPPGSAAYSPGAGGATSSKRVDPKVSFQYQWTPDLMSYAEVSTGYKTGGINPKPVLATDIKPFKAEDLTAYEIGTKSEWLDHRLVFNADAYVSNYKQLQLSEFLPPPIGDGGTIVVNAGHVIIDGIEADFQARPLHGLSIDGSAGYLHYETLSLGAAAGQVGGPTEGTRPPFVPRWKTSLGIQYTEGLDDLGDLTARADWSYQSLAYFDLANTPAGAQPGYSLVNLRLEWADPDDKWTAALEIANVANQLYFTQKTIGLNADGSLFNVTGTPGMPRTAFFTVTRRF